MLREIVLDTETTGIDAAKGDRIIEIGCVELLNHVPSGLSYHAYINPERAVSEGAFKVHGLSDAFLSDKPKFADIAAEFTQFIADSRLVIHNATFDVGFLNAEYARVDMPALSNTRILDTLPMARRKHPGASNSLDALCQRYGIDNSRRTKHGALMDAEILAEVYIELIGGRQAFLGLGDNRTTPNGAPLEQIERPVRTAPLSAVIDESTIRAHELFSAQMANGGIWASYRRQ
ncbi:MAG: DNA polymerase III subunit epsilon [Bosea sp. (in: a-proteobacteria)]